MLKDRIAKLKTTRDQARAYAERAEGALDRLGPAITPAALKTFARTARRRMRTESGGYRRDHLRALAQRVEVDAREVRIMGSKRVLLRTLVAVSSAKTVGFGVPSSVPKWRPHGYTYLTPVNTGRIECSDAYLCGAARTVGATRVSLLKKSLIHFNKLLGY